MKQPREATVETLRQTPARTRVLMFCGRNRREQDFFVVQCYCGWISERIYDSTSARIHVCEVCEERADAKRRYADYRRILKGGK